MEERTAAWMKLFGEKGWFTDNAFTPTFYTEVQTLKGYNDVVMYDYFGVGGGFAVALDGPCLSVTQVNRTVVYVHWFLLADLAHIQLRPALVQGVTESE